MSALSDPVLQAIFIDIAKAADLKEQLQVLLDRSAAYLGATAGLAAFIDRTEHRLEVMAVKGDTTACKAPFIDFASTLGKLLLKDGLVRNKAIFAGCGISANLFVPTADPSIHRALVHLEWPPDHAMPHERFGSLLETFRQISNSVKNAEKARLYNLAASSPSAIQDVDVTFDEPRIDGYWRASSSMSPTQFPRSTSHCS